MQRDSSTEVGRFSKADIMLVHKRRTLAGVAPAKSKTDQTDDMARSDFYLVERPDPEYGAAYIALRQIRRQGRIRQSR